MKYFLFFYFFIFCSCKTTNLNKSISYEYSIDNLKNETIGTIKTSQLKGELFIKLNINLKNKYDFYLFSSNGAVNTNPTNFFIVKKKITFTIKNCLERDRKPIRTYINIRIQLKEKVICTKFLTIMYEN